MSGKISASHLFHATCANHWIIWHGACPRWNGTRWSERRAQLRKIDIFRKFTENFIRSQRSLPDSDMRLLEENLWSLV